MFVQKAVTRMKKMEGTPGYPNQMLSLTTASQEQISYDRFNARRADESDPLRQSEHRAADDARERAHIPAVTRKASKHVVRPWDKLDKALRTTDQILQAGGFRVVVLDIASIASEQALRIPLATWYRFNRAAQEGDAILLLVSLAPCAKSIAKCVLYCSPRFTEGESNSVFGNMTHATEVLHQRVAGPNGYKASGKVVEWKSTAHWMRMVGR